MRFKLKFDVFVEFELQIHQKQVNKISGESETNINATYHAYVYN